MAKVLMLNGGTDMATARLIRSATALNLSSMVPPETGRKLVNLAKSVRMFIECRELAAAVRVLDDMVAAVTVEDDPEFKPALDVMTRAVEGVRKFVEFEGRTAA